MKVTVMDIRDLRTDCRVLGYTSDNLAWSVARYIGDRYCLPVASHDTLPVPTNMPPDDLLSRYIDGNIDWLIHSRNPDDAIVTALHGDYLYIKR